MDQDDPGGVRPGEVAVAMPPATDAGLVFIGRARTPWTRRADCPRQGSPDGPVCRLEIDPPWDQGLEGLAAHATVEVLTWLDRSRRDLVRQAPRGGGIQGVFALRSPVRPNPIGVSRAALVGVEGRVVLVRGLDCLDGTPLVDLKPVRCHHGPQAPSGA